MIEYYILRYKLHLVLNDEPMNSYPDINYRNIFIFKQENKTNEVREKWIII